MQVVLIFGKAPPSPPLDDLRRIWMPPQIMISYVAEIRKQYGPTTYYQHEWSWQPFCKSLFIRKKCCSNFAEELLLVLRRCNPTIYSHYFNPFFSAPLSQCHRPARGSGHLKVLLKREKQHLIFTLAWIQTPEYLGTTPLYYNIWLQ